MNLEHELRGLPIAFPEEPDLAPRVLARLGRPARRWWLAPALVALAAAGALLAIPQTRAAIFDLLRIGGVEVQRVETQPRAPVRPPVLGREVSFAAAQSRADFALLTPRAPFTAYVDGPMVNLRWKRYVLSQWRGEQLPFVQKQVGPGSQTVGVEVRGATGLWITGARHEIVYRVPATGEIVAKSRRLVGSVLIWEDGGVTYRLEGARTVADARAVARNLKAR
ncbi:MAG: hypothetical protein ABI717_04035 [Actinomycetota bacterium]